MRNKFNEGNKPGNSVPILSFFTGGGFLDIGFVNAGFKIVWANEYNNAFANMYEFAMSSSEKFLRNERILKKINDRRNIEDIKHFEIIKNAFPTGRPKLFGIIGGPPCPDFSNGGKHMGYEGDHGRLTQTFIDFICSIKPSFFVLENVHGLIKTEKHRIFVKAIETQLEKAGFNIDRKTLNSLNFGLAQDRDRVFLIGIRREILDRWLNQKIKISERNWFPWPTSRKYSNAKQSYIWPAINNNGTVPEKPNGIPENLMVYSLLSNIPEDMPNAKEHFNPHSKKFKTVCEGDTSRKSFKRLHRYRFSPTACYGNNEVHLHPWENRRLTVREAMRIQGIPDYYSLPAKASLSSKFKMIANGVPVPLSEKVANSLYDFIKPLINIKEKT